MTPLLNLIFSDLVFGLGVPLLVTAGGLLLSDEFKRFRAAKVCFYLAAAWICGRILMWSVFTSDATHVRIFATFMAFGIVGIGLTEAIRVTDHREKTLNAEAQGTPKKPDVQQSSQGADSPNTSIIGNNNTVNNTDPKIIARLDEIKRLLQTKQGQNASPQVLLKKYPLGYVIFDVDYQNSVFPYQSRALEDWTFDWSAVKIIKEEPDAYKLRMPDMYGKGGGRIIDFQTGFHKKLGPFGPGIIMRIKDINLNGEVLAITNKGVVFLLGFYKAKTP